MDAEAAVDHARAVDARLGDRIAFLLEVDRLKEVLRQTSITSGERRENSAEHSWHLALLAVVLAPHAAEPVDVATVVRMVLVHDIVEVDAGDSFVYAEDPAKEARERAAADRLFGLLPAPTSSELRALWDEFEAGHSAEARFARALDRLQPLLLNWVNGGGPWVEHGIPADRVRATNARIGDGAPALWALATRLIDDAVAAGALATGDDGTDGARAG